MKAVDLRQQRRELAGIAFANQCSDRGRHDWREHLFDFSLRNEIFSSVGIAKLQKESGEQA